MPPIELGRPSNTGSLISAVLVGLLAVASPFYIRLAPGMLARLNASVAPAPPAAAPQPVPETPASIHKLADMLEWEMFTLFGRAKAHATLTGDNKQTSTMQHVSEIMAKLKENPQLHGKLDSDTQLSILRSLFMAAELQPEPYASEFETWSAELEASPNNQLASQAAALRFFRHFDLDHPEAEAMLTALRKFSQEHANAELGMYLYLNVANQLVNKGHSDVARAVVRQGADIYKGQTGIYRLVNWLIDHQAAGKP